eukprot:scaffold29140_cov101-Isochrysis_galbana.AAC.1
MHRRRLGPLRLWLLWQHHAAAARAGHPAPKKDREPDRWNRRFRHRRVRGYLRRGGRGGLHAHVRSADPKNGAEERAGDVLTSQHAAHPDPSTWLIWASKATTRLLGT